MAGEKRRPSDTIPIPVTEIRERLRAMGADPDAPYEPVPDDESPTRPTLVDELGRPPEDSSPTLDRCLDCGGSFRWAWTVDGETREEFCAWCHEGAMTAEQMAAWHARAQGRPPKKE